jgi:hypothetical protein
LARQPISTPTKNGSSEAEAGSELKKLTATKKSDTTKMVVSTIMKSTRLYRNVESLRHQRMNETLEKDFCKENLT